MSTVQRWGWPILIIASAILTQVLYSIGLLSTIRTIITTWFVVVCPGMAYVRLLNLRERYVKWTLAVALSVVLTTIVGMVLVYSGEWTIDRVVTGIIGVTLVGVLLDILSWDKRAQSLAKTYTGVMPDEAYRPRNELGENES